MQVLPLFFPSEIKKPSLFHLSFFRASKPVDPSVEDVVGKLKLETVPETPVKYWRHPSGPVRKGKQKGLQELIQFTGLCLYLQVSVGHSHTE